MSAAPLRLHFDRQAVADFPALVDRYSPRELASPYRSTVPLLSMARDYDSDLLRFLADLGHDRRSTFHFEYKVAPRRGKGRESHTDLMVCSERSTLAIEAKWTEPRYATVREWQASGIDPKNRWSVATGWLELLQPYALRQLILDDFRDVTYQMLHRAASACAEQKNPQLVYLQFMSGSGGAMGLAQLRDGLSVLRELLGKPSGFTFHLVQVQITPTAAFRVIEPLKRGTEITANAVRTAIVGTPLFEFQTNAVEKIE